MTETPVIFTTLGDAGGIGPELVARSLAHADATPGVTRLIVGPRQVFDMGREVAGVDIDIPVTDDFDDALNGQAPVVFVDCNPTDLRDPVYGESTAQAGECDLAIARLATELHANGRIDGFVFAPVNKLSLKMGVRTSRATRLISPIISA